MFEHFNILKNKNVYLSFSFSKCKPKLQNSKHQVFFATPFNCEQPLVLDMHLHFYIYFEFTYVKYEFDGWWIVLNWLK